MSFVFLNRANGALWRHYPGHLWYHPGEFLYARAKAVKALRRPEIFCFISLLGPVKIGHDSL